MSNFIPVDQRRAEALEEELSGQIFRSVSDFVQFYNSGLISKKHEDVVKIVKDITETFRDIKEKNNRLIVISKQEVALEESLRTLQLWEAVVKAKRETIDSISQKAINENNEVLLDDSGHLYRVEINSETGETTATAITSEKLFTRKDDVSDIAQIINSEASFNNDLQGYLIPVRNIVEINDEFILQIKNLIPNR